MSTMDKDDNANFETAATRNYEDAMKHIVSKYSLPHDSDFLKSAIDRMTRASGDEMTPLSVPTRSHGYKCWWDY
jgi:hypothetical protein